MLNRTVLPAAIAPGWARTTAIGELVAMSLARIDWIQGQAHWQFAGLEQYARVWRDALFRAGAANTVVFAVAAVSVQMVLGFTLALMTTRIAKGRVLYRTVASDDSYLSPAYGRDTVTISLHHNAGLPFWEYFKDIEPIFRAHGGRPHWGKKHTLTAKNLRPLYPQWERFAAVREQMDAQGMFLNPYLRQSIPAAASHTRCRIPRERINTSRAAIG